MGERALVVIPTYNEAGNLPSLVPQVLAQDPRLEILVVDDKSPDGTGQIADALAAKEPRVPVQHVDTGLLRGQRIGDLSRAVRRLVIHHQDLEPWVLRQDLRDEAREVPGLVVGRDDNQRSLTHAGRAGGGPRPRVAR